MNNSELVLILPPPFNPRPVIIVLVGLFLVVRGAIRNAEALATFEPQSVLDMIGYVIIILFCLSILYRNMLWKESVTFAKSGITDMSSAHPVILCDDLVAIEFRPPPGYFNFAEKNWKSVGFGGEKLLFITKGYTLKFGISLSTGSAKTVIDQIEAYCGRPVLRMQR